MAVKYRGVRGEGFTPTSRTVRIPARAVSASVSETQQGRTHDSIGATAKLREESSMDNVKKLQQKEAAAAVCIEPFQGFSAAAQFQSDRGSIVSTCLKKNVKAFGPNVLNQPCNQSSMFTAAEEGCTTQHLQKGGSTVQDHPEGARKMLSQKPWSYSTKSPAAGGAPLLQTEKSPVLKTGSSRLPTRDLKLPLEATTTPTLKKRKSGLQQQSRFLQSPVRVFHSPKGPPNSAKDRKGTLEIKGRMMTANPSSRPASKNKPGARGEQGPSKEGDKKSSDAREAGANISKLRTEILAVSSSPMLQRKPNPRKSKELGALHRVMMRSSIDLSVGGRRVRHLSQVLRNENEVLQQNQQYVKELQQLRDEIAQKDKEVERARSAGMLLKQLCTTQGEELKALKEAFPAIFKEMSEIQETNYKQEKELDTVQTVITPLQAEIASLQERIACLTADLKQARAVSSTLAERLEKTEKLGCQSCRLNDSSKAANKAEAAQAQRLKENKPTTYPGDHHGKLLQQLCISAAIQEEAAIPEWWCDINPLQESACSNGALHIDVSKNRNMVSSLHTASQGGSQHYEGSFVN
ncbi:unnamed protein product [Sphagnum compactum]